ncbi:MAG: hypothetical protein JNL74_18175 [Fibrobacteres bacterium]|nr:hypothetical protein [Fibrobacterota bacterium]
MSTIKSNMSVWGKEMVFSVPLIEKLFLSEFGSRVHLQDIWIEEGKVRVRVVGMIDLQKENPLETAGFKPVVERGRYDAVASLDDKLKQLVHGVCILQNSW